MRTTASWPHLDIAVDESDPFDLRESGVQIDLCGDLDVLQRKLEQSLRAEAALSEEGCVCPIKEDPYASCLACSVRHRQPGDPMTSLCRLGVEQDRMLTALAIARHAGQ